MYVFCAPKLILVSYHSCTWSTTVGDWHEAAGADKEAADAKGRTPLTTAAELGHAAKQPLGTNIC